MFRSLTDHVMVAPQIDVDDVEAAARAGVTLIVNNRPDGEDDSAPQGAEIASAAARLGIAYEAIPVTHAGFSAPQIHAMAEALDRAADGRLLAYCRSGTRSTLLWALARASRGDEPAALADMAAHAGYDLAPIRPMLDTLASGRG